MAGTRQHQTLDSTQGIYGILAKTRKNIYNSTTETWQKKQEYIFNFSWQNKVTTNPRP